MNEFEEIFNSIYGSQNPSTGPFSDESAEFHSGFHMYAPLSAEEAESDAAESESAFEEVPEESAFDSAEPEEEVNPFAVSPAAEPEEGEEEPEGEIQEEESESDDEDEFEDEDPDEDYDVDRYESGPATFGAYVSSKIAGAVIRLRGGVPTNANNDTVEEDADDLGKELPFMNASRYYGGHIYSLRLRFLLSLVFGLILAYISLGLPVPGMLKIAQVTVITCLALSLTIVVLCLDVFTNGIWNMFHGRFGADSLCVISCFLTTVDAVMVNRDLVPLHMPFCLISSMSLIGLLFASLLSARGIRKALRVPAIGKTKYTVTGELGVTGRDFTLLKSDREIEGFVRRVEEEPCDELTFRKVSVPLLLAAVVLGTALSLLKGSLSNLFYLISVMVSVSVPFTALLNYALPYFTGSLRIFNSGAAIAGWSGLTDIGNSKNLIVTDRDLFPASCIEISGVRIFADYDSDKVISYAGTMIKESKCGLVPAFDKLLQENSCEYCRADNFTPLSGGGSKAMIEGHDILCGNAALMRLMNVKIPSRLIENTSVLLAIDGVLYGIFNIRYTPDPKVRRALVSLMRSNRHPVFAIRDFNVTPDMIRDCFDVATDGYDFPPYTDRFPLSEAKPSKDSKIAGVICREGLGPLTALADTGRSIYVIARLCTVISVVSSVLGMLFCFFWVLIGNSISLPAMFLFMSAVTVTVLLLGLIGSAQN